MMQRVSKITFVGILLLMILISGNPIEIKAVEPIKDTIKLTVKFPDTVGEGFGTEPTNPNEIHQMVLSHGDSHPYRTGWSGRAFSCEVEETSYIAGYDRDGDPIYKTNTNSFWNNLDSYSTIDSHTPHKPSEIKKEIVEKYGQEMYDLVEASGAEFYYDDTTPIPSRFLTGPLGEYNLRVNGTHGRYAIYQKDTTYTGGLCRDGEKAYVYTNNDFFVTTEFNVDWKEPENKEGTGLGRAYWELARTDKNALSEVAVNSSFKGEYDKHVAVRNIKHTVDIGSKHVEQEGPIQFNINAKQVKSKDMTYSFEYEFTNKEIGWVCSGSGEDQTCHWDNRPDWRAVQKFKLDGSIPVDHEQGKTEKSDTLDNILVNKWVVGREDKYDPSKKSKAYYEEYSRASDNTWKNHTSLKTQTTLPMTPGKFIYKVELPSGAHKESGFYPQKNTQSAGTFKAVELDESLQSEFENGVKLQQKVMSDKGMKGANRTFEAEFVSDLFFTTHFTGFMSGYPYAEQVKKAIVDGSSLPSFEKVVRQGTEKGIADFESFAKGVKFKDEWVFTKSEEDFSKLQRYSIPVSPNSELKPGETYQNKLELIDMGLNDLKFMFEQSFSFEHYLFGSGYDEAWIIEQPESRFPVGPDEYKTVTLTFDQLNEIRAESKKRPEEKMHNFRLIDRTFPERVQEIRGMKK